MDLRKQLHGMTVVEMVVALTVACILMVAVVSFLVNGVVSTTKTTAMNDTTTRGRYVFEHMSKELAQADDLKSSNFTTANPNNAAAFSGFNYRINLGGTPTVTTSEFLDKHYVDVTFNVAGYLKPVAGDFLQLPSLQLLAPTPAPPLPVSLKRDRTSTSSPSRIHSQTFRASQSPTKSARTRSL